MPTGLSLHRREGANAGAERGRIRPRLGRLAAALALAALFLPAAVVAQAPGARFDPATGLIDLDAVDWSRVVHEVEDHPGVPLFEMPRLTRQTEVAARRIAAGDLAAASRIVTRLLRAYPLVADLHATRGLLLARQGRIEDALTSIDVAMDLGYGRLSELRRAPDFAELTNHRRFRRIAGKARDPLPLGPVVTRPTGVDGQNALVSGLNTRWDAERRMLNAAFRPRGDLAGQAPIWTPDAEGRWSGIVPEGVLAELPGLVRSGAAAGLGGVFYDNRDRDHSTLRREDYPRLAFVEYAEEARARSIDYGPNRSLVIDGIVIGNSSTALTRGPFARSHGRALMTGTGDMEILMRQFVRNQLYVYPEVNDYDADIATGESAAADAAAAPGRGDLYPANVPFYVMSDGRSGSDRPFLRALASILAAMDPATRAELENRRLIAPTLQMILRRGMAGVGDDTARYLDGTAHRPVLRGDEIDLATMVAIARRLDAATVPPMPVLQVEQDFDARAGVELFGAGLDETLFDTPFATARVWRSTAHTRRVVLRGGLAARRPGQSVRFEWRLLQGIEERVRMTPIGPEGDRLAVEIDWHGRYPVPGRDDMTTARVDIGLFVRVGDEVSIPAIFSVVFPPRQARSYAPGPDGAMRPVAIDYAPALPADVYADPLVFAERRWRDEMDWRPDGSLAGWRRVHRDGRSETYTATGLLVRDRDIRGRPILVEAVDYPAEREPGGTLVVEARPTGERYDVVYTSEEARSGALLPADREGLPGADGTAEADTGAAAD